MQKCRWKYFRWVYQQAGVNQKGRKHRDLNSLRVWKMCLGSELLSSVLTSALKGSKKNFFCVCQKASHSSVQSEMDLIFFGAWACMHLSKDKSFLWWIKTLQLCLLQFIVGLEHQPIPFTHPDMEHNENKMSPLSRRFHAVSTPLWCMHLHPAQLDKEQTFSTPACGCRFDWTRRALQGATSGSWQQCQAAHCLPRQSGIDTHPWGTTASLKLLQRGKEWAGSPGHPLTAVQAVMPVFFSLWDNFAWVKGTCNCIHWGEKGGRYQSVRTGKCK